MKIGIIGLGLIGGSFAKAVKLNTSYEVYGFDTNRTVLSKAKADGSINEVLSDNNIDKMDFNIFCLYPNSCIENIKKNKDKFKKGSIVIDACGIKGAIVDEVDELLNGKNVNYVGVHPMAGTERSGYDFSYDSMFLGASFIITKTDNTNKSAIEKVREFALEIGFGKVVVTTPKDHDEIIAYTSQLAHVVSNAYVKSPSLLKEKGFSAGSFLDLTRVAWLEENMWSELFTMNKESLLFEVNTIIENLMKYKKALEEDDVDEMRKLLREGRVLKEKSMEM